MRHRVQAGGAALSVLLSACTDTRRAERSQPATADSVARAEASAAAWSAPFTDPSTHKAGFVGVGQGVRLHYLD